MVKRLNVNEYITSILVKISEIAMTKHMEERRIVFILVRRDTKMIFEIFGLFLKGFEYEAYYHGQILRESSWEKDLCQKIWDLLHM